MTREVFRNNIKKMAEVYRKAYPEIREGQAVSNIIQFTYDIGSVPSEYDCFYADGRINTFINYCYSIIFEGVQTGMICLTDVLVGSTNPVLSKYKGHYVKIEATDGKSYQFEIADVRLCDDDGDVWLEFKDNQNNEYIVDGQGTDIFFEILD